MPRWLSSKKVETVRALLAGAHAAFPVPSDAMLSVCACPVRRGSGYAVRATPSHALGHSSLGTLGTLATPSGSLRESLGISADGSEKAFGTEAIEAMIKRVPKRLEYNIREPESNINHVFVACDPSGGGASAFSIASLVQEANGFLQVNAMTPPPPCPPATCCTACCTAPRGPRAAAPCR